MFNLSARIARPLAYGSAILVAVTLITLSTLALGTELAHAAPSIDRVSPSWVGIVQPYGLKHVPARYRGSDVQCYSTRTGASYVQRVDASGPYWTGAKGRAVAGFDARNGDFVSFTRRPVLCASWAS